MRMYGFSTWVLLASFLSWVIKAVGWVLWESLSCFIFKYLSVPKTTHHQSWTECQKKPHWTATAGVLLWGWSWPLTSLWVLDKENTTSPWEPIQAMVCISLSYWPEMVCTHVWDCCRWWAEVCCWGSPALFRQMNGSGWEQSVRPKTGSVSSDHACRVLQPCSALCWWIPASSSPSSHTRKESTSAQMGVFCRGTRTPFIQPLYFSYILRCFTF